MVAEIAEDVKAGSWRHGVSALYSGMGTGATRFRKCAAPSAPTQN